MIEKVIEGKAYVEGAFSECCIGIEHGKIVKIAKLLKGEEHIRLKGLILPAAIDIHVHFRDPGFPEKEDFSSGTISAAFGGVSCVLDMPNTSPATTTPNLCKDKISIGEKKAFIDFGIYAGINEENIDYLNDLSQFCTGYKVYLGETTNVGAVDIETLDKLFLQDIKKPIAFHAEDKRCLDRHKGKVTSLLEHAKTRPSSCEKKAIDEILKLSNSNLNMHICHISSSAALYSLSSSKQKNITIGVTPHHLLFKASKDLKPQTYYKVNPPIRGIIDQEALWEGVTSGEIDVIESDHAPHTLEEKEGDFEEAPSGVPGTETLFPLMLYQFIRRNIPIDKLITMVCEKPAKIFGLPKGKIEIGRDADLMVIEPKNVDKIKGENLHSRCGWTPFEGFSAIFPTDLFVRGERIIEERELVGERGFGRFVESEGLSKESP